jgi:hypothetical protein
MHFAMAWERRSLSMIDCSMVYNAGAHRGCLPCAAQHSRSGIVHEYIGRGRVVYFPEILIAHLGSSSRWTTRSCCAARYRGPSIQIATQRRLLRIFLVPGLIVFSSVYLSVRRTSLCWSSTHLASGSPDERAVQPLRQLLAADAPDTLPRNRREFLDQHLSPRDRSIRGERSRIARLALDVVEKCARCRRCTHGPELRVD